MAYCHCVGSVLGCLLDREVAAVGGGATFAVGTGSVVVVGVVGVTNGLGVAKAGERTIELSLGCGVRSGAVGLGGGRPRFRVWSGLLFLMETQSLDGGIGLGGLVVGVSGSGLN